MREGELQAQPGIGRCRARREPDRLPQLRLFLVQVPAEVVFDERQRDVDIGRSRITASAFGSAIVLIASARSSSSSRAS
jgi:hypothetical protein